MKFKRIPAYIVWLRSLTTRELFPHIIFSADTDMVTMGLVSLTSKSGNEVVFTQLTPEEYSNSEIDWVKRIKRELNREDLVEIKFIRTEQVKLKRRFWELKASY